jgi:hypothetical protein
MKLPTSRQETKMSKNYSDMVALLEWATRQKKERKYHREKDPFKEFMKFKHKLEEFERWEKTMLKKDVKQEEKKYGPKISALHLAMILVASFPITAPLYVWWIKSFLP